MWCISRFPVKFAELVELRAPSDIWCLYLSSESSLKIWYVTFCLMLYILSCVRTLFQMLHTRTNMQFYSRLPVNVNTSPLPTEGNTGWDVRERGSNMNKTLTHCTSLNATSEFYWQRWLLTIKTTAPMFLHAPSQHHQAPSAMIVLIEGALVAEMTHSAFRGIFWFILVEYTEYKHSINAGNS